MLVFLFRSCVLTFFNRTWANDLKSFSVFPILPFMTAYGRIHSKFSIFPIFLLMPTGWSVPFNILCFDNLFYTFIVFRLGMTNAFIVLSWLSLEWTIRFTFLSDFVKVSACVQLRKKQFIRLFQLFNVRFRIFQQIDLLCLQLLHLSLQSLSV